MESPLKVTELGTLAQHSKGVTFETVEQQGTILMSEYDFSMNVSATVNVFRLLAKPSLCLPHATLSTFNDIPIPISKAFQHYSGEKQPDIRAVILDKDDCFAWPKTNEIYKPYEDKFRNLRKAYPGSKLLIVSNSAGTNDDRDDVEARALEQSTGVIVLRHAIKKPGCGSQILDYLRGRPESGVERPDQIAIVGDRLFTDVMMANMMGAWGVWVKEGIVKEKSLVSDSSPAYRFAHAEWSCSLQGWSNSLRCSLGKITCEPHDRENISEPFLPS